MWAYQGIGAKPLQPTAERPFDVLSWLDSPAWSADASTVEDPNKRASNTSVFVSALQAGIKHDATRLARTRRPPPLASTSPGIAAVLLCGSTSVSCSIAVHALLASGRSVLQAVASGLTQAEGLRHLAAAASEVACTPIDDGAGAVSGTPRNDDALDALRSEVLALLRPAFAPAFEPRTRQEVPRLPMLAVDTSLLLVHATLLWPRRRWAIGGEWQRLLCLVYALAAAQLVALSPTAAVPNGAANGAPSGMTASGCEWVDRMREWLAPLRLQPALLAAGGVPTGNEPGRVVWESLLPFLRHALLFSHCCLFSSHPSPSAHLAAASAQPGGELDALLAALGLPHPTEIANVLGAEPHLALVRRFVEGLAATCAERTSTDAEQPAAEAVARWPATLAGRRSPKDVVWLLRAMSVRHASITTGVGTSSPFIALPQHFSELYNVTVLRTCEVCGTVPMQPAICLLCGTLVCAGGDCCRVGGDEECCRHAQSKHNGVAAFLVVKRADTLLVLGRKHCWWGSLYLDVHGEEDRGLRRGRPLLLAPNRIAELATVWRANAVREFLHNHPPYFPHLLLMRQAEP